MATRIEDLIRGTIATHERLLEQTDLLEELGDRLAGVLRDGGTVYVMGNGGSAADAQHLAGELVGRFLMERDALPCHALSTDTSILTAVANDYGVEQLFARQVAAQAREGDAVIGITTSGNSPNVLAGIEEARRRGALTVGMTGRDGGRLAKACDICFVAPADETPRIQEAHGTVIHILCRLIEEKLFGDPE
jgi:D-sedoheptulose 7-phosphate isomerase